MAPNTFDDQEDDRQLWNWLTAGGTADPVGTPPVVSTSLSATGNAVNLTKIAGTAVDSNSGVKSAGTLRVVLATDQPVLTTPAVSNITQIGGNAVSTAANGTQKIGLASGATGNSFVEATTANVSAEVGTGAVLAAAPGEWAINHLPAANTQATISKAANASGRHVCRGFNASITANTTAPAANIVTLTVRDGATGAGTVLWQDRLTIQALAGDRDRITVSGLNLVGSTNTAMTIEFTGAGGANTFEVVSMSGYDVV